MTLLKYAYNMKYSLERMKAVRR